MVERHFLISIIVPVFNAENYIEDTFNSIKNQTIGFNNLELIFVDDCSTDNSKQIIKDYASSYSNVKSFFLTKNSGFAGEPRNLGMKNASADYLMFLDADDIFYQDACEFLYNKIIAQDLDLVSGNYATSINGEKNKNIWKNLKLNNNELYVNSVKENDEILKIPPSIMSKIYKKSIILEQAIEFPTGIPGEDLVFSTSYFLNSKNFLFIDYPIFEYVIRNDEVGKSVSYKRGKRYLRGLMEAYVELFYMISQFDKSLLHVCLSRLNYWLFQFISSELSIVDRIELLKFSESLFIEFKNFGGLYRTPDYEMIFDLVVDKKFYEASKLSELLYIRDSYKKSSDSTNYKSMVDEILKLKKFINKKGEYSNIYNLESIYLIEQLASLNIELYLFNKFSIKYNKLETFNAINLIKKWDLFDEKYYIEQYGYNLDLNPLFHYLCWGYKEGKNPSKIFDGIYYQNFYGHQQNSLNPLVYFVLYGVNKGEIKVNKNIYHGHKYVDKFEIEKKIKNFNQLGITDIKRDKKLIVSLTSFPERIYDIHFTIYSLLTQTLKPDKVILWLAEDQFPNKESDIPKQVLDFRKNGLSIEWCNDLKSYKKLIPALNKYPNDIIVTADDDLFYPKDWLNGLYDDFIKYPECIISQRVRKVKVNEDNSLSGYENWKLSHNEELPSVLNFSTNGAGSLFPPNSLNKLVTNEELFKKFCPTGDDIWIWAMAVLNNTKIKGVKNNFVNLTYVNPARDVNIINESTLYASNYYDNDKQINAVINKYPAILKHILGELNGQVS